MKEISNYWKALTFAAINYGSLKRKSGNIPYLIHPIRIISILRAAGFSEFEDEELMIAALFHDLLEDTETTFSDIESQFGHKIATIVEELSIPEKNNKIEWLESFNDASKEAKIIKMADRIDNIMDMNMWPKEKQKSYAEQAKIILRNCGEVHNELADLLEKVIENVLYSI